MELCNRVGKENSFHAVIVEAAETVSQFLFELLRVQLELTQQKRIERFSTSEEPSTSEEIENLRTENMKLTSELQQAQIQATEIAHAQMYANDEIQNLKMVIKENQITVKSLQEEIEQWKFGMQFFQSSSADLSDGVDKVILFLKMLQENVSCPPLDQQFAHG